MGSRRTPKTERSASAAAGVSRQSRALQAVPDALSAVERAGAQPSGPHAAVHPDTGKHPKVGLVTRQTEDGSFEMVYGELDVEQASAQAPEQAAPPPLSRRPALLLMGAGAVLLLLVGVGLALAWWVGGDEADGPRKVVAKKGGAAQAEGEGKNYEYVAPKNIDRVNLDDEEGGEGTPANAQKGGNAGGSGGELNAAPPSDKGSKLPTIKGLPPGAAISPHLPSGPVIKEGTFAPGSSLGSKLKAAQRDDPAEEPEEEPEEVEKEPEPEEGEPEEGAAGEGEGEPAAGEGGEEEGPPAE